MSHKRQVSAVCMISFLLIVSCSPQRFNSSNETGAEKNKKVAADAAAKAEESIITEANTESQTQNANSDETSSNGTNQMTPAPGDARCSVGQTGMAPDEEVVIDCRAIESQTECLAYYSDKFPYRCNWTIPGTPDPAVP